MKIGIVGAGNIGATAAHLFIQAKHEVAISNSRGPETLQELVATLGAHAHGTTLEAAARFGDVVLVAIPFGKYQQLPAAAFRGKIVIDAGNYYPNRDGQITELNEGKSTSSELMASHLDGARLVKGFNTIWSEHLKMQGDVKLPLEQRRAIFISGDDSQAKEVIARLIEEIGFAAIDTGSLPEGGRLQQPDSPIYNKTLTTKEAREILETA